MKTPNQSISINISTFTIFKILFVFLALYFLFLIQNILVVLFVSLIFASAVDPWVDWLQARKLPRGVGISIIYIVFLTIVFVTVGLIIPPIVKEVNDFIAHAPDYTEKVFSGVSILKEFSIQHGFFDNLKNSVSSFGTNLQSTVSGVFGTVFGFFGGLFSFVLVMVLTFYMVVEENALKKLVKSLAPEKYQIYILNLVNRMQIKIGMWLRGQILLSFAIFALTYAGLLILGVDYALVLALIAGLTEFVPYLGPTLGAVPAVLLAFSQSPTLAIMVAVLYYIIQVTENNILVPKIMQKAVGLNPIVSISVLMIGFQIAGVVGAIMSIPVATAVQEIIMDIFEYKEKGKLQFLNDTKG